MLCWFKITELCLRQIDFGAEHRRVVKMLLVVIPTLMSLGEDKSSAGLLGAIGFGRRSPLSSRSQHVVYISDCLANLTTDCSY